MKANKDVKGTYRLNGKWAARIQNNGDKTHLGTFDTEELAAEVYDAACLIYGKSLSAYNDPYRVVSVPLLLKVLTTLRENEALDNEDIIAINNRYALLNDIAQKLGAINGTHDTGQ